MMMGKISQEKRMRNYFKIFEQIYHEPTMPIYDISENAHLSRNTVSTYLNDMYASGIVIGPQIRMAPAPNYREYIYLLNFKDPFHVFEGLKGFPHVLYHGMTFGEWNIMVITDRLLDFSQLVGFETVVRQGVRGRSYTPKVEYLSWEEGFERADSYVQNFSQGREDYQSRRIGPPLNWGRDQWTLFRAFKMNLRQKASPLLRKIRVRYEVYSRWMESLKDHTTTHVGFYPEGYEKYMSYCFLFSSDHEEAVQTLFSCFPSTPYVIECGDQLMIFANLISSKISRNLFCTVYDMKRKEVIKGFKQAVAVFHCRH